MYGLADRVKKMEDEKKREPLEVRGGSVLNLGAANRLEQSSL